jgi:hypothetical protein
MGLVVLLPVLVLAGWAVAHGSIVLLVAPAVLLGAIALARTQRGAFTGVLVLVAMNGIPFINSSRTVSGKITEADVAVGVLLITAVIWRLSDGVPYHPTRLGRGLQLAGCALLLWWAIVVARAWVAQEVSLVPAASFGKDWGFLALLLIVLPGVRLRDRDVGGLLAVLAAGVSIYAIGHIMITAGLGRPGSLIHYEFTLSGSGGTRVYATMNDLVTAGVLVSVAALLLAREAKVRLLAAPVAALTITSTILQLTRARWIGVVAGIVLVTLWFMFAGGAWPRWPFRRRVVGAVALLGGGIGLVLLVAPGVFSHGTVIERVSELFSNIEGGTGTVATREHVATAMTHVLGPEWLTGLGLVPPSAHWFVGLPRGSLRNSDVGVLSALMTIGAIGAFLIYLPVAMTLVSLLRRAPAAAGERYRWLRYGGAMWALCTLVSSITLTTLFSVSGAAMTGVFLTLLAHPSVLGRRRPPPAFDAPPGHFAAPPPERPLVGVR